MRLPMRTTHFATPIYKTGIDIDNDALRADILAWREADAHGIDRSNRDGCWHSQINAFERPAFKPLLGAAVDAATEVFRGERYQGNTRVRIKEMWAMAMNRNGKSVPHVHTGCIWTGVYHVSAEGEAGDLVFMDPRPPFETEPLRQQPGEVEYRIPFRPGQMYIFPAWLNHRVDTTPTAVERISVSFNIAQVMSPNAVTGEPHHPAFVSIPGLLTGDDLINIYGRLGARGWRTSRVGDNQVRLEVRDNRVIFADTESETWRWLYKRILKKAKKVNDETYKVDISGGASAMQFARYGPGQKYDVHTDSGGKHPNRTLSCAIVLRNAEKGGGTRFPRASQQPETMNPGDAVFFRADERHAALPVETGTRDTLVVWFEKGSS